ncbi:MAG TPA: ParB/RepB/Spo0J family partition protein [Bryobacteraceae bacterium]
MTNGPDQKRKALGKGLSALLPSRPPQAAPVAEAAVATVPERPTTLPITAIRANPTQPRTIFAPEKIEELAQSIRVNGIIQPLIVRKMGDHYELIAGERRLRAAKQAMLETVPVVVQDLANDRILEVALIENIQREDLNAIELAIAYDRLNRDLGLSHEEIGRRTGKDRSSIANTIRLLKLPPPVQQLLSENRLSMGQARALLGLPDETSQIALAEKAVAQGLSTRQVEALVRQTIEPSKPARSKDSGQPEKQDPNIRAAADDLERVLGTRVRIVEQTDQRGRIEIEYYSQEDLMRIFDIVTRDGAGGRS